MFNLTLTDAYEKICSVVVIGTRQHANYLRH